MESRVHVTLLGHTPSLREIKAGTHGRKVWRQELRQKPWRKAAYWQLFLRLTDAFLTFPWITCPGMMPLTVSRLGPPTSIIRKMFCKHAYRPIG